MSKHPSPTVIGGFVITALAVLFGAIMVFGGGRYFHRTARIMVYFDGSIAGLRIGAPVKFRGIEIGRVGDTRINLTGAIRDPANVKIPVRLDIDEDRLKSQGVTDIELRDPAQVKRLVDLGLRASLETDSLVTGVLYVSLDVKPNTPARLVPDGKYPQIPPSRTAREAIPAKLELLLTKLADVDFAEIARSLQSTIDHVDNLVGGPDATSSVSRLAVVMKRTEQLVADLDAAARDLRPTIADIRATARSARTATGPSSQLSSQIDTTLREIQGAARSVRRLSDQLTRDPGSIMRGGKP